MGLISAASALAAVYKWVDKDGHVQYGDQPPPDQTSQSHEINTSGVPLALQKRLKQLDQGFAIKRISGNLDTAWVCLEVNPEDNAGYGREPPFVVAFRNENLGSIKPANVVQARQTEYYDEDGNLRTRYSRSGEDLCPTHPADAAAPNWLIYEIKFDPKAVMIYHGAQ